MTTPQSKPRRGALVAVVVGVLAALAAWFFWGGGRSGAPGAGSAVTPTSAATAPSGNGGPQLFHKPLWQDLSNAQQLALQPLKNEWDVMEGTRKRKWLEMSRRFASMSRAEQDRVHERMRQWVRLTPEQRNLARENFTRTRKLAPGEKTATWESYKQLTPDQKRRLAQTGARKNPAASETPSSTMIVAPTSCPPGTTRRGASCMSLQAPASIPNAPAITQPAPAPAAPAGAAPAPAAPAAPSSTPTTAAPSASNANG